ncbi:glyoxalase superfamily protein [Sphingomonas sp. LB-2]|uniref:glyoxalase superfamily protein n=1 Tax=Sphingomonas caeni TaxID=2984949 RepID=UPI00222E3FF1|nr:glyoxalase superfamily protein [Sphingomonas caeni]MCW3847028.1 glyoxalase superfamily protein [Sphingomonas caeni]
MTLIPTVKCRDIAEAVQFYTGVLDFEHQGTWPEGGDPAFAIVTRDGHELHLSSHSGDGVYGQAVAVLADDVEGLFKRFVARGLDISAKPDSPVHQAPLIQSWGTREFYADDPSGNTLRFIQRL